jgi:hypothetical protein
MAILTGFPPSNTISPSVRIAEKDLSFVESTSSFHRAGLIGFASKGPINVPTLVRTHRELNTIFGFPHPDVGDPYLIYAAEQYLRIANELYVVRVGVIEPVNDEAATIAEVNVPSAGTLVSATSDTPETYSFSTDSFFRWKLNGVLASKSLVVLADANRPAPDAGSPYTCDDLVETLNDQLTSEDGIEFFCTDDDEIGVQSTFAFGTGSELELMSVQDSIYGGSVLALGGTNVSGLGTGMERARNTGTNLGWPTTGSLAVDGSWTITGFTDLNLQIVIAGTDNVLIDNVVQVMDLSALDGVTLTTAEVVTEMNTQIASLPGGFQAIGGGVGPADVNLAALVAADNITLITNHFGRDAQLLVKSDSTLDSVFGFSNLTESGVSPIRSASDADVYVAGRITGDDSSGEITMVITADSPGVDGNSTQVVVTSDPRYGTFTFDVYNNGNQVEVWGALTKDETSSLYVETFLSAVSNWIRVEDVTSVASPPADGTYDLSGGSDGIPADPDDQDDLLIGSNLAMTGLYSLSEPDQVDIDLIAIPGHPSTAVIQAIIDFCENERQDCLGIIDPPFGLTVEEVVQWQNGTHPLNDVRFDTDFAALYWPWVRIRDTFNNVDVWAPPSGSVMATIARSDSISFPWWAPAGAERGQVPGITEVFSRPTLEERDLMYGFENAINPIVQFADIDGFVIWGQKTLQRRPSALDRVNVRRMMFAAEKRIRAGSRRLLFDPYDDIFVQRFTDMAAGVLDEIATTRGLVDYRIQADSELNTADTIDRNEFYARIGIQPTRAVEFIFIEFSVHRTGSFDETSETF